MYDKKILKDNLPKRMRYYQGMIDLNILEKGENYKKEFCYIYMHI